VKTTLGIVRVIAKKAQKIGLKSHQRLSQVLEKCCWLLAANEAYLRSVCRAEFQKNEALVQWVNQQKLATMINCIGDGHPGVWNIVREIAQEYRRREILDWFHLVENLALVCA
jgi:hypothetical protein